MTCLFIFFFQSTVVLHTSELLHRTADLTHTHVGVSRHSEGVELTTAQVEERTAAVGSLACGVHTRCAGGLDSVVLSQVTVVPRDCADTAAAVLLHRSVLWFARGWKPDSRSNNGRLTLPLLLVLRIIKELHHTHQKPPCSRSLQSCHS